MASIDSRRKSIYYYPISVIHGDPPEVYHTFSSHLSSRAFGPNRSTTHFSLHLSYPRSLSTFPPCCSRYHSSLISLVLYISSTAPHIFIHIYLSYSCTPKQPKYQIKYRTMVHQPDNPPVASTESGGPATSPTLEERPHDFRYEVCSFSGQ